MSIREIGNPITKIGDVIRGSIIAERPEQISHLFRSITEQVTAQGGKFYVKNFWADPKPLSLGYVGVHVKIRMPLAQSLTNRKYLLMELQLHVKAIMDGTQDCAKEIAHRLYKTPHESSEEMTRPEIVSTSQLVYLTAMTRLLAPAQALEGVRQTVRNLQDIYGVATEEERRKTQLVTETALLLHNREIGGPWSKELRFLVPVAKEVVATAWMEAAQKINQKIRLPNVRMNESDDWTNTANTVDAIYNDAREMAPIFRNLCTKTASAQPGCLVNFGPNDAHMIKEKTSLIAKIEADREKELKRYMTELLQKIGKSWAEVTESSTISFGDFRRLQTLNFSGCHLLTDADLRFLEHLPALQTLNLSGCIQITDGGLSNLEHLFSLQNLNLSGCHKITDVGLGHLWSLRLQSLNLLGCDLVTDAGLRRIGQQGRNILRQNANANLRPPAAATALAALEHSYHAFANLMRTGAENLRQLRQMAERPQAAPPVTIHAQSPSGYRSMTLEQRNRLGISPETNLSTLHKLKLDCSNVRASDWTLIVSLPQLHKLKISCGTDDDLRRLKRLPNLQKLEISFMPMTDSSLALLGELSALQSLDLFGYGGDEEITNRGWSNLERLSALQSLSLHAATDTALSYIGRLSSLRKLRIDGLGDLGQEGQEDVTNNGLAHIAKLSALEDLTINLCDEITDRGLTHIARLTSLLSLRLCNCSEISDAGLDHLTQLSRLQKIHLDMTGVQTKITPSAVSKLRQHGVDVKFENFS